MRYLRAERVVAVRGILGPAVRAPSGEWIVLGDVALAILELCREPVTVAEVTDRLGAVFELERDRAQRAVAEFMAALVRIGVLARAGPRSPVVEARIPAP